MTGRSEGPDTRLDYATVKYNSSGVEQWVARYDHGSYDGATAIAVDNSGNVYVTGGSKGWPYEDYATVKYNSSGIQEWVSRYDGPENAEDWATAIGVDGSGNVYVTGLSVGTRTTYDYATIKYDPHGVQQWVARYNGPAEYAGDQAHALVVDALGNVYVTGGSSSQPWPYKPDYATIKYDSSGALL